MASLKANLVFGSALLAAAAAMISLTGCSAAPPVTDEPVGAVDQALNNAPSCPKMGSRTASYACFAGEDPIVCDFKTQLKQLCPNAPKAVWPINQTNNWWFRSTCPISPALQDLVAAYWWVEPVYATMSDVGQVGEMCGPGVGMVWVDWDPNCPRCLGY